MAEAEDDKKPEGQRLAELYPCEHGYYYEFWRRLSNWKFDEKIMSRVEELTQAGCDVGSEFCIKNTTTEEREEAKLFLLKFSEEKQKKLAEREKELLKGHPEKCSDPNCPLYVVRLEALENKILGEDINEAKALQKSMSAILSL